MGRDTHPHTSTSKHAPHEEQTRIRVQKRSRSHAPLRTTRHSARDISSSSSPPLPSRISHVASRFSPATTRTHELHHALLAQARVRSGRGDPRPHPGTLSPSRLVSSSALSLTCALLRRQVICPREQKLRGVRLHLRGVETASFTYLGTSCRSCMHCPTRL